MQSICNIASTWAGSHVAVTDGLGCIAVWNLDSRSQTSEFECPNGADRLAITPCGEIVIAGAYRQHGVMCFEASSGKLLWQRKDLRTVQSLRTTHVDDRVYCSFDKIPNRALRLSSGKDSVMLRHVGKVDFSPYDENKIHSASSKGRSAKILTLDDQLIGKIQNGEFSSVAFAPGLVLVCNPGGLIRCYDLNDTNELWGYTFDKGKHAIKLAFNDEAKEFLAIRFGYQTGGDFALMSFDSDTGNELVLSDLQIKLVANTFCCRGTRLLSSNGDLFDTVSGDIVGRIPWITGGDACTDKKRAKFDF